MQVSANNNANSQFNLHCMLNDFAEHTNLAPNFERVKVYKIRVRIYPHQNVSNDSTSTVPLYAIFPYHKDLPSPVTTFANILSIDKCKIRRQTQYNSMTFVPASLYTVFGSEWNTLTWRPEFELLSTGSTQKLYTGGVFFEGVDGLPEGKKTTFTIVYDVFVKYKNQRSII